MGKYQSRAKRASEIANHCTIIAESLREIVKEDLDDDIELIKAQDELEELELSDIECLRDEMCSWRDNMTGTNLESTNKFTEVDECASVLEGLTTDIEIDSNEDIETAADDLETIASELESLNFPGMY